MAKTLGRKLILARGGVPIANLRTKSLSVNRAPGDVTDDDSSGWREILPEPTQIDVSLSVEGLMDAATLRTEALNMGAGILGNTLTYPDGGVVAGDFFLASYEEGAPYNDAVTFSGELQSSGIITYTPPA